jgi:uncharacterized membrane protein YagU involved in acid resistance
VTRLLGRDEIVAGVAAGIVAAITLDAFRLLVPRPGVTQLSPAQLYAFDASALVGDVAVGSSWGVALGVVLHVAVSIGWAFGYVWLAPRQPQLLTRPIVSGVGYGLVVWLVMLILLIPAGKFAVPTVGSLDRDIIAHVVFFGLPLALVVSRLLHPARA